MRPRNAALKRLALLATAGLIVAACAGGPKLIPIGDSTQRVEFDGFSILPPEGNGWLMLESPPKTVPGLTTKAYFIKRLTEEVTWPSKLHRLTAVIRTISYGDVKFESRAELLRHLAGEFSGQSGKTYLDKCLARDCVRYESTRGGLSNPHFPGFVFVISKQGFLVLHPDSPNLVINLEYRQYYAQGKQPISVEALETEVEPFQQSLEFRPLR